MLIALAVAGGWWLLCGLAASITAAKREFPERPMWLMAAIRGPFWLYRSLIWSTQNLPPLLLEEPDADTPPKRLPRRPRMGKVKSPCPECRIKSKHTRDGRCTGCGELNPWLVRKWKLTAEAEPEAAPQAEPSSGAAPEVAALDGSPVPQVVPQPLEVPQPLGVPQPLEAPQPLEPDEGATQRPTDKPQAAGVDGPIEPVLTVMEGSETPVWAPEGPTGAVAGAPAAEEVLPVDGPEEDPAAPEEPLRDPESPVAIAEVVGHSSDHQERLLPVPAPSAAIVPLPATQACPGCGRRARSDFFGHCVFCNHPLQQS